MVTNKQTTEKETKTEEAAKLKGKYIASIGRRKTSTARVRLYKKGDGSIVINDQPASTYFTQNLLAVMKQPLKLSGLGKDISFSIVVTGGGSRGQSEAVRHGISRALVKMEEELKPSLKTKGLLSRDPRKKERKKPGLKKARRAAQWSKR